MSQHYPGTEYVTQLKQAAAFLRDAGVPAPDFAVVLGSGLGGFVDEISEAKKIPYSEIPHFPLSSAVGHAGNLVYGKVGGKTVAALAGRVHQYEGHSGARVAFAARTLCFLGAKQLIVTNAAGAVNIKFKPGDLVLLSNIIGFFSDNPSTGVHHPELGEMFYDVSFPFDPGLIEIAKREYAKLNLTPQQGVYLLTRGPAYETAAEINAAKGMGADLVGMSTVPEVLAARQMKRKVLGISLVTNMAAGTLPQPLDHSEVLDIANKAAQVFRKLVRGIIEAS